MGIVELLAAIGDDRIKFQNLDACTIQADWSRGAGTKITFGTGEPLGPNGTDSLGLVVWLPRDEVKRILAALPVQGEREEERRCLTCGASLAVIARRARVSLDPAAIYCGPECDPREREERP